MANPQAEDGHIDIANEIAEQLAKIRISGQGMQVLWVIFRKTWGWHKKVDAISHTQFAKATGIERRHIGELLDNLIKKNLITKNSDGFICKYGIQKDWEKWELSRKNGTVKTITKNSDNLSRKNMTKLSRKNVHTKEKKENIQKKRLSFNFIKKEFTNLTKYKMEEFDNKYPDINVDKEIEKMENWLMGEKEKRDNGEKNKIPKDYSKFMHNWLRKE